METYHFWAFFIIALLAGASIAFAATSATMTGHAFTWSNPFKTVTTVPKAVTPSSTLGATGSVQVTGCGEITCLSGEDKVLYDCLKTCLKTIQDESMLLICIAGCVAPSAANKEIRGPSGSMEPVTNLADNGDVLCCYADLPECCPWKNAL